MSRFFKKCFALVPAAILLLTSVVSAHAEAAERPNNEAVSQMVYDCLRAIEKTGEDPSDYTLAPAPIYGYGETEPYSFYWFLIKKGTIVDMSRYSSYTSLGEEDCRFPDLEYAIAHRKPIALAVYLGGFYLVEESGAKLIDFQFYAKDLNPEKPISVEELDFSAYRDVLAPLELIRLGEYRREYGKLWRKGNTETEAKKLGFRFYQVGWNEFDGERYYLKKDGTLATSALTIGGIRYKFDKSGVCQGKYTGYTKSGKGRRYWKDGELLKNTWISVKGERKYYAGADGYFVTGTRKIRGKTFVFDENGVLQK